MKGRKITKRLLITLIASVVAVIITVAILSFTLFALKIDNVSFKTHNSFDLTLEQKQDILEGSGLKNGSNVFFIKKQKVSKNIEGKNPTLKVINLETVFPSGIVIHVAKREECFAVRNHALNFYTILDYEFKVLKVLSQVDFDNLQNKPIVIEFSGSGQINLKEGEFVNITEHEQTFSNLAKSFLTHGRDVEEQKHLFKSITLTGEILVLTLKDDFQIRLHSPNTSLGEKVSAMFSSMSLIYPTYQTDFMLEVYKTQNNTLVSKFSKIN